MYPLWRFKRKQARTNTRTYWDFGIAFPWQVKCQARYIQHDDPKNNRDIFTETNLGIYNSTISPVCFLFFSHRTKGSNFLQLSIRKNYDVHFEEQKHYKNTVTEECWCDVSMSSSHKQFSANCYHFMFYIRFNKNQNFTVKIGISYVNINLFWRLSPALPIALTMSLLWSLNSLSLNDKMKKLRPFSNYKFIFPDSFCYYRLWFTVWAPMLEF